jgi:GNAT superfamily N-acetyltransferase
MSAGDSLHPVQFHLITKNQVNGGPEHAIHATQAGQVVGQMRWTGAYSDLHEPGEIRGIRVDPEHQRKGVASGMYAAGRAFADLHGIEEPQHSSNRTKAGDAWAHSVTPKEMLPPLPPP